MNRPCRRRPNCTWLAGLLVLLAAGCAEELPADYGRSAGSNSVNGTGVLADMFRSAGHEVSTWRWLSPRLYERAEVIVWFPDDYSPPSQEVIDWLDVWLSADPSRVLIYVGRDFDAAPLYWQRMLATAPAEWKAEVQSRLQSARSYAEPFRPGLSDTEQCDWFTIEVKRRAAVKTLQGREDWLAGIDPTKVEIEWATRLIPPQHAEVLLSGDGQPLVSRYPSWAPEGGDLILVANGSFLLNMPLVNHEHRKLAASLIAEVGPAPRQVVFLESWAGGPPILDEDPHVQLPLGLQAMTTPPLPTILLHAAVLGLVFIVSRYPRFGRPLDPDTGARVESRLAGAGQVRAGQTDFGQHVIAVGDLMARAADEHYAQARLKHYHQVVRGEQVSNRRPPGREKDRA